MIIDEYRQFDDNTVEQINDFDERLKAIGIKRPKKYKAKIAGGNMKLGNMGSFSKLYGDQEHDTRGAFDKDYVDTQDVENKDAYKQLATLQGSCGKHCEGCKNACYVAKSYLRRPSVVKGHSRNSQAMKNLEQAFADLDRQLTNKRIPFKVVRIHQSGELESEDEFALWCDLARRHPETTFYIYTKAYEYIDAPLSDRYVPNNLHVNISIWKDLGVNEFRKYQSYPNVKAFCCIPVEDGIPYDYKKEQGLDIPYPASYCMAYNEKGKLNHDITCDMCKKCFDENVGGKVIGCYEH